MAPDPDRWATVDRLYHEALGRPAEERAAFLGEACAGDEELRREVESLLACDVSGDAMFPGIAAALAAGPITDPDDESLSGQRFGPYEILDRIGVGGMGEVYRARDTRLGRDVAIKFLPRAYTDDPERLARFEREARTLAALNHPNIATIHGLEEHDGIRGLVMELVEGDTLADRVADGPIPVQPALEMARQICTGLEAAHERDIVHRDLKPANIKIRPGGFIKLLDFGLAKLVVGTPASYVSVAPTITIGSTSPGAILGTASYMSPEQAEAKAIDKRTDIWAFGCVLFEMLTGRRAFQGETALGAVAAVLHAEPRWNLLSPRTPKVVRDLLRHCLQKDPNERPSTITDVRKEIDRALAGSSLGLRHAAAVVLALFVVAIGVRYAPSLLSVFHPAGAPASQLRPFDLTQQAAKLLDRDDKADNIDRAITLLNQALSEDRKDALAYAYLADAYISKNLLNPDSEWLRSALEAAETAVDLNPDLGAAHVALGRTRVEAGQDDEAVKELTRAIVLDPVNPLAHVALATAFADQNQDAKAEAEFRNAIARGTKVWRTHLGYGQFLFRHGRYAEAASEWETAGMVAPDNVIVFRNVGAAYNQLGRYDEAASAFQRALEIQPSGPIYTNLGTLRFFQGRYAEAVDAFEKAVELGANIYLNWGNLGDGLRWAPGRRGEASAAYRHAIDLIEKQIAQKPEDLNLLTRHAVYLVKMGEREAALKEIAPIGARSNMAGPILNRVTTVYELAGDRVRALKTLEQALRGGYPTKEIENDPEFTELRTDVRYHRLIDALTHASQ